MDYLARDTAPFDAGFWKELDTAVVETASATMVARRVIPMTGPLGPDVDIVAVDSKDHGEEVRDEHIATVGRSYLPLPQLYEDFWLYWRDIAKADQRGSAPDFSAARRAAAAIARREDRLVFYGIEDMGVKGIINAKGVQKTEKKDWTQGENAFLDISEGITKLEAAGCVGRNVLVVSSDMYLALNRLQPGTGLLEIDRIASLVGRKVYKSTVLTPGTAVLLCAETRFMDLCVGMDIGTAYLELVDLNHHFRLMETAALRLRDPSAVVVFG